MFKILLVDDEEEFVRSLAERLEIRRFRVEVAVNGEQALHAVSDEPPDVMVLDLKMPGMDGMEVLRRVKKNHPEVQIVILTGHGSHKDEEVARRLGAFDYLQKPADIDELIPILKRAYQRKVREAGTESLGGEAAGS